MLSLTVREAGFWDLLLDVIDQHLPWRYSQLIHSQIHSQLMHNDLPYLRSFQDQSPQGDVRWVSDARFPEIMS